MIGPAYRRVASRLDTVFERLDASVNTLPGKWDDCTRRPIQRKASQNCNIRRRPAGRCNRTVILGVSQSGHDNKTRKQRARTRSKFHVLAAVVAARPAGGRVGTGDGHHRRRRDVPVPDLRQMGRSLQGEDRRGHELPVDRLRRRHQADSEQDGRLRRVGHAAEARGPGQGRADAVSDRHRRRRARRQSRRRQAGRAEADRSGARRHLSRQDHQVE